MDALTSAPTLTEVMPAEPFTGLLTMAYERFWAALASAASACLRAATALLYELRAV